MNLYNLCTNDQAFVWYQGSTAVVTGIVAKGSCLVVPHGFAVDSVNFPLTAVPIAGWFKDGAVITTEQGSVFIEKTSLAQWHTQGQGVGWGFVVVMLFAWAIRRGLNPSLPAV